MAVKNDLMPRPDIKCVPGGCNWNWETKLERRVKTANGALVVGARMRAAIKMMLAQMTVMVLVR